jgi:hypothetical protein
LEQVLSDAIFVGVTASNESQIYRDLLRFKPVELSLNAWAVNAGVSRAVWTDMRRHGNPSRRTLEKLLAAVGSTLAEFEALRFGPEPRRAGGAPVLGDPSRRWSAAPLPPLPLLGSSLGGEWGDPGSAIELTRFHPGELIDRLDRPRSLAFDPDAFALIVLGSSMSPRFRPGSRIAVSPRSPVAIGDDVLVRLHPGRDGAEEALIKQLVEKSATAVHLHQHHPARTFEVGAGEVDAILKVVGELI